MKINIYPCNLLCPFGMEICVYIHVISIVINAEDFGITPK